MRHENVTVAKTSGLDWKAAGYLISIVSVLFLGAVAAAKEDPPVWYYPALIIGVVMAIAGMGCRYVAHLRQRREIAAVKRQSR